MFAIFNEMEIFDRCFLHLCDDRVVFRAKKILKCKLEMLSLSMFFWKEYSICKFMIQLPCLPFEM